MSRLQPHPLFDALKDEFGLRNDAALCRLIGATQPEISRVRARIQGVSAGLTIRIHHATKWTVERIASLSTAKEPA